MTVTRTWRVALLILLVAVAGAALWAASFVSVARLTEDVCFDDLDGYPGYGAFKSESVLWPPSYECSLLGNDVEPIVVQHRVVAIARLGATVVFPLVYVLAASLFLIYLTRGRRFGRPGSDSR